MKVFISIAICCSLLQVQGAPSLSRERPCLTRSRQVQSEIADYNDIISEPHYVPECDASGRHWKSAQCSHHDRGYCFCVDIETGVALENTRSHIHSRETINCVPTETPTSEAKFCQQRQNEYRAFRLQWPGLAGIPFEYFPACVEDGSFEALQRDSISFFCVDTTNGEKIPGTDVGPDNHLPIQENICQAYSSLWQQFMVWLRTTSEVSEEHEEHDENITENSCLYGFEFNACGCTSACVPGADMELEPTSCDRCKPVCKCPAGYYEYNGTCITNEECMYMEQTHQVRDVRGTVWREYLNAHMTDVIRDYINLDRNEHTEEGLPHYTGGVGEGEIYPVDEATGEPGTEFAYQEEYDAGSFAYTELEVEPTEEPYDPFSVNSYDETYYYLYEAEGTNLPEEEVEEPTEVQAGLFELEHLEPTEEAASEEVMNQEEEDAEDTEEDDNDQEIDHQVTGNNNGFAEGFRFLSGASSEPENEHPVLNIDMSMYSPSTSSLSTPALIEDSDPVAKKNGASA